MNVRTYVRLSDINVKTKKVLKGFMIFMSIHDFCFLFALSLFQLLVFHIIYNFKELRYLCICPSYFYTNLVFFYTFGNRDNLFNFQYFKISSAYKILIDFVNRK